MKYMLVYGMWVCGMLICWYVGMWNVECGMRYVNMWVCGIWYVICWYVICGMRYVDMLVCDMWYVVCDMWYVGMDMWYVVYWYVICWYVLCGMLMLICWYGDRYWKCGCFCQFFGKTHKWTKKSAIRKKYDHIETLRVWPYIM
jgi:hypothetical protein